MVLGGLYWPDWPEILDREDLPVFIVSVFVAIFSSLVFLVHQRRGIEPRGSMVQQLSFSIALAALGFCAGRLLTERYYQPVARAPWAQVASTSTTTAHSTQFTVPAEADDGANLIPNVEDPQAADPQTVCPGYTASNVSPTRHGFTADLDLAGKSCNVYGTDVNALTLIVEYQAGDRLHVEVLPRHIGAENSTWFILPEKLVPKPISGRMDPNGGDSRLEFSWDNDPTFSFTVKRKSNEDVLFTTKGKKLVFEDQFFEIATSMPNNYNVYGLGEFIHGFRLGNNLTSRCHPILLT
jgi:alpha-glucosidase